MESWRGFARPEGEKCELQHSCLLSLSLSLYSPLNLLFSVEVTPRDNELRASLFHRDGLKVLLIFPRPERQAGFVKFSRNVAVVQ